MDKQTNRNEKKQKQQGGEERSAVGKRVKIERWRSVLNKIKRKKPRNEATRNEKQTRRREKKKRIDTCTRRQTDEKDKEQENNERETKKKNK